MGARIPRQLCIPLLLLAEPLVAVSAFGSEGASAQALFDAGREAMARADYRQACQNFQESERLEPAVGTRLNLATCEEKQGHLASAWHLFTEARDALTVDDERLSFVQTRIEALASRLPRVIYRINNPPSDIQVDDGGTLLLRASLGASLPVDPGQHKVSVRVPGHNTWSTSYAIAEGERKSVQLQVGLLTSIEPVQSAQETAGYWLLGIGAAGLAAAGVTGVMAANSKAKYEGRCSDSACESEARRGKTLVLVNAVAWIAGLASVATGAGLVLGAPSGGSQKQTAWHLVPTEAGMGIQTIF